MTIGPIHPKYVSFQKPGRDAEDLPRLGRWSVNSAPLRRRAEIDYVLNALKAGQEVKVLFEIKGMAGTLIGTAYITRIQTNETKTTFCAVGTGKPHTPGVGDGRRGNCYVASEALYHCLGGKESGWVPHVMRISKDETHWFLARTITVPHPVHGGLRKQKLILDPSRGQFGSTLPDYWKGRACGFLTKQPSRRARLLMEQLTWQYGKPPRACRPRVKKEL